MKKIKKIISKYRVCWSNKDSVLFDTYEEAKDWIRKVGDPSLEIKEIPGVIKTRPQRCGLLTARNERVWVPLEAER